MYRLRPLKSPALSVLLLTILGTAPWTGTARADGPPPSGREGVAPGRTAVPTPPGETEGDHLYRVVLLRAAPGGLLPLIELLKEERDLLADAGEPAPLWMRHSQGDQWDLMILYPMGSFHEYFEPERVRRRLEAGAWKGLSEAQLQVEALRLTAWRDELFVRGPSPEIVARAFEENTFYHVEMFVALAGRRAELLQERRMENAYLRELGRPLNLIFVREAGGPWDVFTVGFYRDLKHYAESADLSPERQERAARKAGFEGRDRIGSYLRTLIASHHDTLAGAIR